jgi:hypothetical protein
MLILSISVSKFFRSIDSVTPQFHQDLDLVLPFKFTLRLTNSSNHRSTYSWPLVLNGVGCFAIQPELLAFLGHLR